MASPTRAAGVPGSSGLTSSPAYRTAWSTVAIILGTVGALGAVATLGALGTSMLLLNLTWVLAVLGYFATLELGLPLRAAHLPAFLASIGAVVMVGLVVVAGWWAAVLQMMVMASAPRLVAAYSSILGRRRRHRSPSGASVRELVESGAWRNADPDDLRPTPYTPAEMGKASIGGLCRFWTESSSELEKRPGPRRTSELVALRDACMEEMRQRDPRGYERWCSAGATLDPAGFLVDKPR